MGHLFLLDRETGAPLFPVEERPCRRPARPARRSRRPSRSRRCPPPLHPPGLSPDDAWGLTPWDRGQVPREDRREPLGGDLHAAEPRGLGPVSGGRGRLQLGQRRLRSRAPPAGGEHEPDGERRDAGPARSARSRRRGEQLAARRASAAGSALRGDRRRARLAARRALHGAAVGNAARARDRDRTRGLAGALRQHARSRAVSVLVRLGPAEHGRADRDRERCRLHRRRDGRLPARLRRRDGRAALEGAPARRRRRRPR